MDKEIWESELEEKLERCRTLRNQIAHLRESEREAQHRIDVIEAGLDQSVIFEIGSDGKPRFSNETLRKAEGLLRKDANPEIQKLTAQLRANRLERSDYEAMLYVLEEGVKGMLLTRGAKTFVGVEVSG